MPLPGPLWRVVAWQLPQELSQPWWSALWKARWTTAVAFREAFGQVDTRDTVAALLFRQALVVPEVLITLVEALLAERCLLRHEARAIEEAILARVDAAGNWKT